MHTIYGESIDWRSLTLMRTFSPLLIRHKALQYTTLMKTYTKCDNF